MNKITNQNIEIMKLSQIKPSSIAKAILAIIMAITIVAICTATTPKKEAVGNAIRVEYCNGAAFYVLYDYSNEPVAFIKR